MDLNHVDLKNLLDYAERTTLALESIAEDLSVINARSESLVVQGKLRVLTITPTESKD